jgi:two-component system NtrC family sensor kinase
VNTIESGKEEGKRAAAPRARFFKKTMLISVAAALIPLYALGASIYFYFLSSYQKKTLEDTRKLAESRANAIHIYLTERTTLLKVLAGQTTLLECARPGALDEKLELLNEGTRSFIDLGAIDREGSQAAYSGPYPLAGRNYRDAPWFQDTLCQGVHVSDVFLGYRGVPHIVIAIRQGKDPSPWVLRATLDSEVLSGLVRFAQMGETGDAYLVNTEGVFQTPPRFEGAVLKESGILPKRVPPGVSVTYRWNAAGEKRLTAYAWLPKEKWLLVVDQDAREGLPLLATARTIELSILTLGSLVIVLTLFVLNRMVIRQLGDAERDRAALDSELAHSSRLAALGRMAAGVAHEINNPLAAIGEIAGLMDDLMDEDFVEKAPSGPMYKEEIGKIISLVERAGEITRRMLGFARRMEPKMEVVDPNLVVKETVSFLEKEAYYRQIEITLDLDPAIPRIRTDRSQLQQVFLNILNNAIDAVQENGHVLVSSRAEGQTVAVVFKDDGPGMDAATLSRVFDPFFTTKQPGQGTGLGLSISHSIMEKLGGGLSASSEPGQGAVFTVRLPVSHSL